MGIVLSYCNTCCNNCCFCFYNRNKYLQLRNDNDILKSRIKSNPKYFYVLDGCLVGLKFVTKSSYEDRYIWINLDDNTIHVSPFVVKIKEHKEASLLDIIKLTKTLPKRYDKQSKLNGNQCLTIEFERGGSIDIKFENETLRDLWYEVLSQSCPHTFKSPITSSIELQKT